METNYKVKSSGLVPMMNVYYETVGWFELQHILEKLLGFFCSSVSRAESKKLLSGLLEELFIFSMPNCSMSVRNRNPWLAEYSITPRTASFIVAATAIRQEELCARAV